MWLITSRSSTETYVADEVSGLPATRPVLLMCHSPPLWPGLMVEFANYTTVARPAPHKSNESHCPAKRRKHPEAKTADLNPLTLPAPLRVLTPSCSSSGIKPDVYAAFLLESLAQSGKMQRSSERSAL